MQGSSASPSNKFFLDLKKFFSLAVLFFLIQFV